MTNREVKKSIKELETTEVKMRKCINKLSGHLKKSKAMKKELRSMLK